VAVGLAAALLVVEPDDATGAVVTMPMSPFGSILDSMNSLAKARQRRDERTDSTDSPIATKCLIRKWLMHR
jgi:hypothetical protein